MIEIEKCALCEAEAVLKNSNNGVGASYIKCKNSRNGGNNCKNSIFVDGWGDDGDYIEKWNIILETKSEDLILFFNYLTKNFYESLSLFQIDELKTLIFMNKD